MSKLLKLIVALVALVAAPAGAAPVTKLIANHPEVENWNAFGPGQSHWRKRDGVVPGGVALHVDIDAKQKTPWDVQAQAITTRAIASGDKLLFAFWARSNASAPITTTVQGLDAPYSVMGTAALAIGPDWKLYCVPGTATAAFKIGKFGGVLQIGDAPRSLELGPAFLLTARTPAERRDIAGACSPRALFAYAIPTPSIDTLKAKIAKIMADNHVPGISLAVVRKDGPEWVGGLGKADVAKKIPADADSLFRIGSTSKGFAALSILKLEKEGKLSLNDPLRKIAPEVWFDNKWEATDPVRVVDLLSHTTGWDDLPLSDYVNRKGHYTDLGKQLDLLRASRVSRWRPGTRMAYCNMGPVVAAYIVEKITHQRFEDYVAANFFQPMGMTTATYFPPDARHAATLYHADGKTPFPYWFISGRAAGSINASARDMSRLVLFFLNRGTLDGREIAPASAIARMETPTRNWAADVGSPIGYGLANYTTEYDGRIWHGHNGGVMGGLTDMSYLPEAGVGYSYSINSGNGIAFPKIGNAIRDYLALDVPPVRSPKAAALPADIAAYTGWYEPASVRNGFSEGLEHLLGLRLIRVSGGTLTGYANGDSHFVYIPVSDKLLRRDATPIPAVALIPLEPEGRFIQFGMGNTMKQIPAWQAWLELVCAAWFALAVVLTALYAPFWLIWGIWKRHRKPAERWLKLWPLIAVIALVADVALWMAAGDDIIERVGNLTVWSGGIWLTSVIFALAGLAALISLRRSHGVRRWVFALSTFTSLGLVLAAAYLTWWGLVGVPMWG